MVEEFRYLGTADFVSQLSEELLSAPLKTRYRSEAQMKADVVRVVQKFTKGRLGPLGLPYEIQERTKGLQPVPIFGADFCPDMAIEVTEFPSVAFVLKLVKGGEKLELKISSAIGQALIFSRYYSAVIAFILSLEGGETHKHWTDWELKADLWRKHKVRLVIR